MGEPDDEAPENGSILTDSFLILEEIDENLYRGTDLVQGPFARSVFGGQVVAHSLKAAYSTVPPDQHIHSLHCYYLRPGNRDRPIVYHVSQSYNGKTYCNRNVKAVQNGAAIFTIQLSFKKKETDEFRHQYTMPDVPAPETLLTRTDIRKYLLQKDSTSERQKKYLRRIMSDTETYELKPVDVNDILREKGKEPKVNSWIRALGNIGDNRRTHEVVLSFISDMVLDAVVAPVPWGGDDGKTFHFMTSLDHSVWFHNEFRIDDWMLFEKESPYAGDGRGITFARMWRRDGTLAASIVQEAVIRTPKPRL